MIWIQREGFLTDGHVANFLTVGPAGDRQPCGAVSLWSFQHPLGFLTPGTPSVLDPPATPGTARTQS